MVQRLARGPFKAEIRVRFPLALPILDAKGTASHLPLSTLSCAAKLCLTCGVKEDQGFRAKCHDMLFLAVSCEFAEGVIQSRKLGFESRAKRTGSLEALLARHFFQLSGRFDSTLRSEVSDGAL